MGQGSFGWLGYNVGMVWTEEGWMDGYPFYDSSYNH